MNTTNNNSLKYKILVGIEILFVLIIIIMGGYGYNHFFSSEFSSYYVWMIIGLFVIIEFTMIAMTTMVFSSSVKQNRSIGISLFIAMIMMWLVSGVGIDQTIWSMVEKKYKSVETNKALYMSNIQIQKSLEKKLTYLKQLQNTNNQDLKRFELQVQDAQKLYNKNTRKLNDTIWNNGRKCNTKDCISRKNVAQNSLDLSQKVLNTKLYAVKTTQEKISNTNDNIRDVQIKLDDITQKNAIFNRNNQVVLKNKASESLMHIGLMNAMNKYLNLDIKEPQRAYVLLLSFIVYPLYILFESFVASNSQEMIEKRKKEQEEKIKEKQKNKNNSVKILLELINNNIKKLIKYLITTRKRKVITKEIEKEVEVIKEIEKEVYKDGKEIVKVEVEVPYIIEKEVLVEKIVHKPIIQKELVLIPEGYDINRLNKLVGNTMKIKNLNDVLKKEYKDDKFAAA